MKKRISAIALILAMAALTACGTQSGAQNETQASTGTSADTTSTETAVTLPDYKLDLGGEDFKILYFDPVKSWGWSSNIPSDVSVEEQTGDILADAIYARNSEIEEMYNVKIVGISANTDIHTVLEKSVMSNSAEYDAAFLIQQGMSKSVTSGILAQLDDILDFENPWWDENSLNGLSLCGKTYAIAGDITFMDKLISIGVFFNKNMAADFNLGDIYQLVIDKKWTFDEMLTMCRLVSADLDNNGTYDENDRISFSGQNDAAYELLQSAGERFCTLDKDGIPFMSNDSERAVSVMMKIYEFMGDKSLYYNRQERGKSVTEVVELFKSNHSLFIMRPLQTLFELRNMDADFGIIPTPMMDSTQTQYYTSIGFTGSPVVTIPVDAKSVENSAKVLDTLAAESYLSVNSAFYDVVLGTKLTRDDNSTENLDIILKNRIYDPGCIFGFGSMIDKFLSPGDPTTVASTVESYKTAVQTDIEKLVGLLTK